MKVRWWHIVLIAFFVVLFLFLAYWQWTRFRSGSGTFQNLGYAFQWPLFAVFVVSTLTRVRFPTMSVPSLSVSIRRTSNRTEA